MPEKAFSIILLLVFAAALIPMPIAAHSTNRSLTPSQTTSDLNLTVAGGWFRGFPLPTTYIDEWGATTIYRYPVSQFIGGYLSWDSRLTPWTGFDGLLMLYSYAYGTYTNYELIFFDTYSIAPSPYNFTIDTVTDITSAPYNSTTDAIYFTAVGRDFYAQVFNTSGIPVYYSGVYGALTDGDFITGDLGYFDFDLPTARALFGGDNNVTGIALTTLTVHNGIIYAGGFYVYNDTGNNAIDMPPIIVEFNATNITAHGVIGAANYPSTLYVNGSFLPTRMIYYNDSIYMFGYYLDHDTYPEYIFIYEINATDLSIIKFQYFPIATGSYVGSMPWMIPYSNEYPFFSYLMRMDAVIDNETNITYIASIGFDQNGDPSAMITAFNLSSGSPVWQDLIGSDNAVDFASGIDLVKDYRGGKYVVATGSLNYTVSENITGFNAFYAVLNATNGDMKYLFALGGKGTDLAFDLGRIVYQSPDGPIIRPFYTAFTTNSTDLWLRNITDLYAGGTLHPTMGVGHVKPLSIRPVTAMKLNTNVESAKPGIRTADKIKGGFEAESHQSGYYVGGLLQPALPPATTITVTHEPERALLWNETTRYVLINITAQLNDTWTHLPISGEQVWLYVAGPNINWSRNATAVTNDTGYVTFQFNATQPGTYTFEVLYPGTALHYRAFQDFQVFLSNYRVIIDVTANATSLYTMFEKPVAFSGTVYVKNDTWEATLNDTTVILDVYFDPILSYIGFGDFSHTGWFWDQGYYFPDLTVKTDDHGHFEVVVTNNTWIGGVMWSLRSDYLTTGVYMFRVVVPANDTVVTPENTSSEIDVTVNPTPTRLVLTPSVANNTEVRAGTEITVTAKLEWSHDGFATTHPVAGQTVTLVYDAHDAGITTTLQNTTDSTGTTTFTVPANTLGTLYLNLTSAEDSIFASAFTFLNYTVAPAGINVSVVMPPSSILSIDNYKIRIRIFDNETGAPKANVTAWVYINGTAYGPFTSDANGEILLVHDVTVAGLLSSGPLNLTVIVNGTVQVGSTLVKTYDVTNGSRVEYIVNVQKTPVYFIVNIPDLVNATEDYSITPYMVAFNSTGYEYAITATLGVSTDYGFTGTVTTGSAITITGTPDAGNYTLTLSYPGSSALASNTTSYTVQAKWFTRTIVNPDEINATVIDNAHARVTMLAHVERYYFNESAWKPMPGVTVKFYYIGSHVVFATNTTGPDGTAVGSGIVPRNGEITGLGASASGTNIQPSSGEVGIDQLPGDVVIPIMPAPEPPILPVILMAAILLFIIIKKRK